MTFNWSHYVESVYFPDTDTAISYTVLPSRARGFDTSYWNHGNAGAQKPIDFQAAYNAGYRFWIGRLTRGSNYIDTWIERDYQAASATPLIKGVYHVLFPGEPVGAHIDNLKRGLALLPEPPKAIALDLERGAEFGAAAVTKCLVDSIAAIRAWWGGKLLLYSNLNYFRNYIHDRCGLDIWIAWPSEVDVPPITDWTIWQKSWGQAIPGVPDPTTDYNEFNGDEAAMQAYFGADEPEPTPEPEDNMLSFAERLGIVIEELQEIKADMEQQPIPPEPPTPPPPPPPSPSKGFRVLVDKTLARFAKSYNANGFPIMAIYPSDTSLSSERIKYYLNEVVQVVPITVKADGGSYWYAIYGREGAKGEVLYIAEREGVLI